MPIPCSYPLPHTATHTHTQTHTHTHSHTHNHTHPQPGDKIVKVSATFGNEIWDAQNYGQVCVCARARVGMCVYVCVCM